jgi:thiamine-monophosphate kinase
MTTTRPDRAIGVLGERALIERIHRRTGTLPDWVQLGIGDDAAVLAAERNASTVVTSDALVEHVHFRRDWSPMTAVGHKALAVNLSDLAAMGASPRACLLSLALPDDLPLQAFDDLVTGITDLAASARAPLVGGNISRSPGPLVVDVTAIGAVHARRVMTRAGGRPGDLLYVSGSIGAAAAGLSWLESGVDRESLDEASRQCVARFEWPTPRVRLGRVAAHSRAVTACIDLSDGLAEAVRQLAEASRTGARLSASALPIPIGARRRAESLGRDVETTALAGGEDYELLFAVARKRRRAFLGAASRCSDVPVTLIGELTEGKDLTLDRGTRLDSLPSGFRHF